MGIASVDTQLLEQSGEREVRPQRNRSFGLGGEPLVHPTLVFAWEEILAFAAFVGLVGF